MIGHTSRFVSCLALFSLAVAAPACIGKGHGSAKQSARGETGDNAWCMEKSLFGKGCNLLAASKFDDGAYAPWAVSFTTPADGAATVKDGKMCVHIANKGKDRWDAQVRHREMVIEQGHKYVIEFEISASEDTKVYAKVGMSGPPYGEYWGQHISVGKKPKGINGQFKMTKDSDPTAEFGFHLGGAGYAPPTKPFDVCIDNIKLLDSHFAGIKKEKQEVPVIRVNQVEYLASAPKTAVLLSDSKEPVPFKLLDAKGAAVFSGTSKPFGMDSDAGEAVHTLDFTAFEEKGKGFRIQVGKDKSPPFDIAVGNYARLRRDALRYFYYNRSGIEIAMPFAVDAKWTHSAGHKPDVAKCYPGSAGIRPAGCNYTLDVSGGWYDAGDYGKYVVNGGISVWTLLALWERSPEAARAALGDGKLDVPERGNGTPDLLDEVKWELDFMLRMQVPDGKPKAGMVHNKVHDDTWSAIGLAPGDSKGPRSIHIVTTAATLNLAAVTAQAARVYKPFDAKYAATLLAASERAYAAAKANPKMFADKKSVGGGPYDDDHLEDEFFWAQAELAATTGKPEYLAEAKKSEFWGQIRTDVDGPTSMTWGNVAALGNLSIAVAGGVPEEDKKTQRDSVVKAADFYLTFFDKQGHRVPFGSNGGKYPWGSNSFVLNNSIILALAYDFTQDVKYASAVADGMGYIFGRNALGKSYVTGWGSNPLLHPHHRFWAKQANGKFPEPPPGVVSGGPNSSIQDPAAQAAGLAGCKPQKCFFDNIESWSTNEITINWNAPLAYVVSFMDEVGKK